MGGSAGGKGRVGQIAGRIAGATAVRGEDHDHQGDRAPSLSRASCAGAYACQKTAAVCRGNDSKATQPTTARSDQAPLPAPDLLRQFGRPPPGAQLILARLGELLSPCVGSHTSLLQARPLHLVDNPTLATEETPLRLDEEDRSTLRMEAAWRPLALLARRGCRTVPP